MFLKLSIFIGASCTAHRRVPHTVPVPLSATRFTNNLIHCNLEDTEQVYLGVVNSAVENIFKKLKAIFGKRNVVNL